MWVNVPYMDPMVTFSAFGCPGVGNEHLPLLICEQKDLELKEDHM